MLVSVFGVGETRVGEVEGVVELGRCHGWEWRIHDDPLRARLLDEALCLEAVALFLDVVEVLSVVAWLAQAVLEGVQDDVVLANATGDVGRGGVGNDGLGHSVEGFAQGLAGEHGVAFVVVGEGGVVAVEEFLGTMHQLDGWLLTHAIENGVGAAVEQDTGAQALLPVVVVRQAAQ